MRFYFEKRIPGEIEFGIIYGGIALFAIIAARFLPVVQIMPPCLFKAFTGLSCPTCGATRSVMQLSHGDIIGAIEMNPAVSLMFVFAVFSFAYGLLGVSLKMPRIRPALSGHERKAVRMGIVTVILFNWSYLLMI